MEQTRVNGSRLAAALAAAAPSLTQHGYAVVDDALGPSFSLALRDEMAALHALGLLRQHRFGFKPSPQAPHKIVKKPHIFEAELSEPQVRDHAPCVDALAAALPSAACEALPELRLVEAAAVKLQCNEGHGGCFPLHFDNAGPPSKRKLTALVYLNAEWAEADGGEIELVPWLAPPVVVPPLLGRLVLFRSDLVLHRVLPSAARRYCFTVWVDGEGTNQDQLIVPRGSTHAEVCAGLTRSGAQRLLSRAVYAEEYARSLTACMTGEPELHELLASHEQHVAACVAPTSKMAPLVHAARSLKGSLPAGPQPAPPPPPPRRSEEAEFEVQETAVGVEDEASSVPLVPQAPQLVRLRVDACTDASVTAGLELTGAA